MSLRAIGILLFLFIPVVLVLFLAHPLGTLPSVITGLVLMIGHRFVAQPFSERHRRERCLWCGRDVPADHAEEIPVVRPNGKVMEYQACAVAERDCARRWLGLHRLATGGGLWIRIGILLPLLNLLLVDLEQEFLHRSWMSHEDAALVFRGVIALTVVSVSFFYLRQRPKEGMAWKAPAKRFPFPPHNLTLLGASWTLWIFRIVGIWWLVAVGWQLWQR